MDNNQLDDAVYKKIVILCRKGDAYIDKDEYKKAIACYQQAFVLLPTPHQEWDASTWILFSLGEAFYFNQQY